MNRELKTKEAVETDYYINVTCYNYDGGSPNNLSNGNAGMSENSYTFKTYKEAKQKFESMLIDKNLKEDIKNTGWYAYAITLSNDYDVIENEIIYLYEKEDE